MTQHNQYKSQFHVSHGRGRFRSTCVADASYDIETSELVIAFQARGTYQYHGVDLDEWEGLRDAASQGTYFNLYIKDRYGYERIG